MKERGKPQGVRGKALFSMSLRGGGGVCRGGGSGWVLPLMDEGQTYPYFAIAEPWNSFVESIFLFLIYIGIMKNITIVFISIPVGCLGIQQSFTTKMIRLGNSVFLKSGFLLSASGNDNGLPYLFLKIQWKKTYIQHSSRNTVGTP